MSNSACYHQLRFDSNADNQTQDDFLVLTRSTAVGGTIDGIFEIHLRAQARRLPKNA